MKADSKDSATERERMLSALVNAARETLMLIDLTGTVLIANEVVARRLGTTLADLTGSNLYDRLSPDVSSRRRKEFGKVALSGEAAHFTDRREGRYYSNHAYPVFENGSVTSIAIFAHDVTEEKENERRLLESEERYRIAIEHSNDGVVIIRGEERLYSNRKYAEMLGYDDLEEFQSQAAFSSVHPEDREALALRSAKRQRGENAPSKYECRLVRRDGSVLYAEISASTVVFDGLPAALGFIRDVSDRKRTEKAIRESEEKYRSVVESSVVGFYIIQDDLFRFVNERFCRMHGYSREEIIDRLGPGDIVHPDERERVLGNVAKRLSGMLDPAEYEFRAVKKDGKVITLKVYGATVNYNGAPAATGTLIDTTRENLLETQLRQSQKMEAVGTLTGGIAHDFNNILTAIIGCGTLAGMEAGDSQPIRAYLDQMLSSARKAAELTQSLLAFSRQQPLTLKPLSLNEAIGRTTAILGRLVTEDITLRTILTGDETVVMADAIQIDQILINLTTNARDAMQKGGTLTIETRRAEMDKEFIDFHGYGKPGVYAVISVSDSGTGMDKTTREKAFDPFFTTKPVGKGTGLGLSTVYGLVKKHGGYISVYGELGHGTTFNIYLPAAQTGPEEKGASPAGPARGGEVILVAEDDRDVRRFLSEILATYGYTVIQAEDGQEAIEKFRDSGRIDLVILDSVMPRKNGRETWDEIIRLAPCTKVLFTSGYTRDVMLDKGIGDGDFDFIPKPLFPNELLRKVRHILDR